MYKLMRKLGRYLCWALFSGVGTVLLWLGLAAPGQAHWADLSVAEVRVAESAVEMTLTYPTGLTAFADGDRNGQLSAQEIHDHTSALQAFLSSQIQMFDGDRRPGTLTLQPLDTNAPVPSSVRIAPNTTHSTLRLTFAWPQPVQGLQIRYNLFLPDVPTASCLTTILQNGQLRTFLFTPTRQTLALTPGLSGLGTGELLLAIAGAFLWGAVHSLSPGHGKTVVGAYLVGERATPKHAIFLALTTTITHTFGVFALGLVTLFAAQTMLPEQLDPWLSLASGVMVIGIGANLLCHRLSSKLHSHHPGSVHQHPHSDAASESLSHRYSHPHSQSAESAYLKRVRSENHHPHLPQPTHAPVLVSAHGSSGLRQDAHEFLHHSSEQFHVASQDGSEHCHHSLGGHSHKHSHGGSLKDSQTHLHCRSQENPNRRSHNHSCEHSHRLSLENSHSDSHRNSHLHSHKHSHEHSHGHSHLPPGAEGEPVTWRSLVALGVSGGLVPCPAALVLLLSAIALGKTGFGLLLVLAFSLGLAGVLTGLGLLLVRAKHWFRRVPTPQRWTRSLPLISAAGITLLGVGISIKAVMQLSL